MNDSEQTSMEILKEWLAGRGKHPVTWNTLIEVLHDTELCTLAREIEAVKLQGTSGSSQRTLSDICEEVTGDSDQRDNREIPTGSNEDCRSENSDKAISDTEANISVNTNRDLGLKYEDISDSEGLEDVQEQKDQGNNASNEIGRTKTSLIEDEYLD